MSPGLIKRLVFTGYCVGLVYAGLIFVALFLRRLAPESDWLADYVDEYRLVLAIFCGLFLANLLAPLLGA